MLSCKRSLLGEAATSVYNTHVGKQCFYTVGRNKTQCSILFTEAQTATANTTFVAFSGDAEVSSRGKKNKSGGGDFLEISLFFSLGPFSNRKFCVGL